MLEIGKLLFSKFGLAVLALLGVCALGFGIYEYGKTEGNKEGYQTAWNTQQKTINTMVDQQKAEIDATNQKLADLEASALASYQQAQLAQQAARNARAKVITVYKQANPQVAASCGWSMPTVQTINQLIDAGPQ